MKLSLLKTGATFPELAQTSGCYEQWFAEALNIGVKEIEVIDAPRGDILPSPETLEILIISGSPVSVYERLPWSENAARWLKVVVQKKVPTLGVCYGHQLLAYALGAEIRPSKKGREMGAVEVIQSSGDALFSDLPQRFQVWQTHIDEVVAPPIGSEVIAYNEHCAVQALRYGAHCASVQWHPELTRDKMCFYINARAEQINREKGEGYAGTLIQAQPQKIPSGPKILQQFISFFCH